ncbi:MAG TPA: YdeI/OmpD-associated family protein [Mycobacteriales bacterium]|jgi:uncharacterized protein YdeI (YjbR/CyaY-like superfamily)|nr:YdeI/OmpD-associated family protein [Mycobacteriales bacterium]
MDTPDREPDLPEPLARHLDSSPPARDTWDSLSPQERSALAHWIHQSWFEHGEQERAEELFEAMTGGRESLAGWTRAQQHLPRGTAIFGLF